MKKKQAIALLLATVLAGTGTVPYAFVSTVYAGQGNAPDAPTNLKTEMLNEAYGIDTKDPAFSWVVNDKDQKEVQTAYRIIISETSELKGEVLDTGWVESDENSYAHAEGLSDKLQDNELYYWQVQTKDKDGNESPLSEACPFMTNVSGEWQSLNGIWATPNATPESGEEEKDPSLWTDFTLEQKMSIKEGGAFAMLVRMDDAGKNGYMVQFRSNDNQIKIHQIDNGTINTNAFQVINLAESEITLPEDGSEFGVRIDFKGIRMTFSILTDLQSEDAQYVEVGSAEVDGGRTDGRIGYRTGRTEAGTIDDLVITSTDEAKTVLYSSDFESDDKLFSGLSVVDGKLNVGKSVYSVWSGDTTKPYTGETTPEESDKEDENLLTEISRYSFFRSPKLTIENTDNIDKAIVSTASRGTAKDRGTIYDIFMNGTCLGAGSAREMSNVGKYSTGSGYTQVYYNSYDVTELLTNGDANVISAVGNSRDDSRSILVQMTVFYKDGTKQVLTNSGVENSGWKTLDGTNAFGDDGSGIGTGYVTLLHDNINAEKYPAGWQNADYDDSKWASAVIKNQVADSATGTSGRVLYPYTSENVLRETTKEATKKVYINKSGNVVVDLGKEIIGGMKVNIESDAKQSVTVHMGEEMNGDNVKYQLSAKPVYEDTWTLKEGTNEFETATMRNFRYVELIGLDDVTKQAIVDNPDSIMGWAIKQEFDQEDSSFKATDGSDAATLLNRLWELSKYSIEATNQDVFTDSQARERAPYEGDLLVNSSTSYAVSENYSLARHSNEWLIDNQTWPNDYRIFSVEMSYLDYMYTGNKDSISEYYTGLKKKLTEEVEYEDSATGLIRANGSQAGNTSLIDWPTSERDGYQGSYYDVVFNAEYVGIYLKMADISTALGKTDDAKYYTEKSEKLKESLLKYAYDKENGCFYDSLAKDYAATKHSSTHATAYALTYGVFDSQEMADQMCDFVYEKCKDEFKGSVYVTYFILKGLYNGNHGDYAEKLMTNQKVGTDVKTFASLLDDLNCTITPEAWGHKWKGNMTMSHPWGAAPGCSIVQGTFGIMPIDAGFDEFTIKFQPGEVASAEVTTPSVKGEIQASYANGTADDIENLKMTASVTIPVNTKAKVSLPVPSARYTTMCVNGEKVKGTNDGTYLTVELGSGTYDLSLSDEKEDAEVTLTGKVSADTTELILGKTAQIKTTVKDQFGEKYTEAKGLKLTYTSSDETVATVDEKGVVTPVKAGTATVTVTAEYNGTKTEIGTLDFNVVKVLKGTEVKVKTDKEKLEVGDTAQVVLVNVYDDGSEEEVSLAGATFSVEGEGATIDESGNLTITGAGEFKINVSTTTEFEDATKETVTENLTYDTIWSFDGQSSPLSGVNLKDGKIYAAKGQKVVNTDEDKKGNVVSGTFTIENIAANIAFNVQDGSHQYFWQFRSDSKTLKKHTQIGNNIAVYGAEVPIVLNDGENTFLIATVGDKIYTYLNDELIDVCDVNKELPTSGGFGIRNGGSESSYISNLNVGSNLKYTVSTTVTAEEKVQVNKNFLNKTIEYAKQQKESEEFNNAIVDVQKSFSEALEKAETVAADKNATQEEVDAVWQKLLTEVHKLGMIKGDITSLEKLVDVAEAIDLDKYVEVGQVEFKDALKAAQDLIADKDNAMQKEITETEDNLLSAMLNLRFKADKSILKSLIEDAETKEESAYTAESYTVMALALNDAKVVIENENATQEEVDEAAATLKSAIDGLVVVKDDKKDDNKDDGTKGDDSKDDGTKGDDSKDDSTKGDDNKDNSAGESKDQNNSQSGSDKKETTAKNRASKTGDMTSLLFPALMLTASAGAIGGVAVQRKKKGNKRENSKK